MSIHLDFHGLIAWDLGNQTLTQSLNNIVLIGISIHRPRHVQATFIKEDIVARKCFHHFLSKDLRKFMGWWTNHWRCSYPTYPIWGRSGVPCWVHVGSEVGKTEDLQQPWMAPATPSAVSAPRRFPTSHSPRPRWFRGGGSWVMVVILLGRRTADDSWWVGWFFLMMTTLHVMHLESWCWMTNAIGMMSHSWV